MPSSPIEIILVPDIFYYNWNEGSGAPTGEVWMCLRPMVNAQTPDQNGQAPAQPDFMTWALCNDSSFNPDGSLRFTYVSPPPPGSGGTKLPALHVNLPSDVNVTVQISRAGQADQSVTLARDSQCNVIMAAGSGLDTGGRFFADPAPGGTPSPFVRQYNSQIQQKLERASPAQQIQLTYQFLHRLNAGRDIVWSDGQVSDPYPGTWLDLSAGGAHRTSLYWFLGQMMLIGHQGDPQLTSIDRIDITLSASPTGPAGTYQTVGSLLLPELRFGARDVAGYFQQIGTNFQRKLTTNFMPRRDVTYVGPGLKALQQPTDPNDPLLWRLPSVSQGEGAIGPTLEARSNARRNNRALPSAPGTLAMLAAIDLRGQPDSNGSPSPLPADATGAVQFIPGVSVSGTLKPYRRFPSVPAGAGKPLVPTVLQFHPDPRSAPLLDLLLELQSAGAIPSTTLSGRLLPGSNAPDPQSGGFINVVVNGWRLSLLHAGRLPWDGPLPHYKVLATPQAGATSSLSTFDTGMAMVFFPVPGPPIAPPAFPPETPATAMLQRIWAAPASTPDGLDAFWRTQTGGMVGWVEAPINAVQIANAAGTPLQPFATGDKISAALLFLDDFVFHSAESTTRFEAILALDAPIDVAPAGTYPPSHDYKDDLVNYNTAIVEVERLDSTTGRTSWIDIQSDLVFGVKPVSPLDAPPAPASVNRQTIPISHAWPRDPRDQNPRPTTVSWQDTRAFIAAQYGVAGVLDPEAGPYRIELAHTYGATLPAIDAAGQTITPSRSPRLESPVWSPAIVKDATHASDPDTAKSFLTATYDYSADAVLLSFDLSRLLFPPVPGAPPPAGQNNRTSLRPYMVGLSAWRALAELATADSVEVQVTTAQVNLAKVLSQTNAQQVAEDGFAPDWTKAIVKSQPLTSGEVDALKTLATSQFSSDPVGGIVTLAPIFFGEVPKLGDQGNVMQVSLNIVRGAAKAPLATDDQILRSVSQQPGNLRTKTGSIQAAWEAYGFGASDPPPSPTATGSLWSALDASHVSWTEQHTSSLQPVTPSVAPPSPATTKKRSAAGALIAALDGTDWFVPDGDGPTGPGLAVQPVLLPLAFAPCAPDPNLGIVTQAAIQRLGAALRDTIDLAFTAWAVPATDWATLFTQIAALAAYEPISGKFSGKLVDFTELLTSKLLFPQPDVASRFNDPRVCALASAVLATGGDLSWIRTAAQRLLLQDPGLFLDAKALLLTQMVFSKDATVPRSPAPGALVRSRFQRVLDTSGPVSISRDAAKPPLTSVLTVDQLVLSSVGAAPAAQVFDSMGYLEVLDGARYNDRFEIPQHGDDPLTAPDFSADSYERAIHPEAAADAGWRQSPIVVPLAAQNTGTDTRSVHLASRDIVSPPVILWSGQSDTLLAKLSDPTQPWTVAQLINGYTGSVPTPTPPADLQVVATRSGVNPAMTADEVLAFAVYQVRGDEGLEVLQSLANDSFFVQTTTPASAEASAIADRGGAQAAHRFANAPASLRTLLYAPRGSADAAKVVNEFVLSNGAFSTVMSGLIVGQYQTPPDPGTSTLFFIPASTSAQPALPLPVEVKPSTQDRICHVVVFAPTVTTAAAPDPVAYVLVSFPVSAWSAKSLSLIQGRNVPRDGWLGGLDPNPELAQLPHFAPEFWQVQPQSSPPTRLQAAVTRQNIASDWPLGRASILGSNWSGVARSVSDLLSLFLFGPNVGLSGSQYGPPLLTPNDTLWPTLSINIYHEQFDQDPTSPDAVPTGRFPLWNAIIHDIDPMELPTDISEVWFRAGYNEFSIDFQWFSSSGTPTLRLERLFAKIQ
jgi:hypothetical protein